jgi:glycosyltransferase involved in cell wall biosynthesis
MRVLTVARWYPSYDSPGRGSFVADLVAATASAGVDARVVSFDRVLVRGRLEARERVLTDARAAFEHVATPEVLFTTPASWGALGVPVARLPMVRRPGADPIDELEDHAAALGPFVDRLIGTWRPDVIHAHTGLPDGVAAADLGERLGIPVVVSEHTSTIEAELADAAALERYRSLLRPGVGLFAVSASLGERIARLLGIEADRIAVMPNPVDAEAFPAATGSRTSDQLLWVGSLGEHKGIEAVIRAFAALRERRSSLRLRLIGGERSAGELERWRALAADLGVADVVSFEGWADRAAVSAAMRQATVFVHPSLSETFGVAAAEAILTGLPVAARPSGGVPGILERSGGFGRVAADDSVEAFTAAIEATLDGTFESDAASARTRLLGWLGSEAVARQAISIYEGAIGDDRSAGPVRDQAGKNRPVPRLLVASGRDEAWRRLAELPESTISKLTVVLPSPRDGAADVEPVPPAIRVVEAGPIPHPTRPPSGRSPITRLRRLLYKPAPTGEQLLARAVLRMARSSRSGRGPVEAVALDAPAATLIDGLDHRRVVLASGALRWLADRWDAESSARR